MNNQRLQDLIRSAAARGILPADALPENITRPWPIVLITGLCAWLGVLPLIGLMIVAFRDALTRGPLTYVLGCILLAAAIAVLRGLDTAEFAEQLALPALLAGGALLAFGLYRDMPDTPAGAVLTLIIVAVTWLVPHSWLRVLLGALACATFIFMASDYQRYYELEDIWPGVHFALFAWLAATLFSDSRDTSGAEAARLIALESAATGWGALILLALALSSGQTFLLSATFGSAGHGNVSAVSQDGLPKALSLALAMAGAAWLAYRWPGLRTPHLLLAAAMLAALSWLMPTLGGALLLLAVCVASSRWRLAVAGAISAAWITGTFYYQLSLPLATKAVIMTGMGAVFGLVAWLGWRGQNDAAVIASAQPGIGSRWQHAGIGVSLAATLIVANVGIWQKEQLIAKGRPVFIELAPVDPRSLMQGDYMALNFHMPTLDSVEAYTGRHVKTVAKIDARGIAVMQGMDAGKPLAANELRIELLHTGSGLRPATDAWYFKEGEGDRWVKARYGEFRIDGNGRALLVGLRGANLEKL